MVLLKANCVSSSSSSLTLISDTAVPPKRLQIQIAPGTAEGATITYEHEVYADVHFVIQVRSKKAGGGRSEMHLSLHNGMAGLVFKATVEINRELITPTHPPPLAPRPCPCQ